MPYAEQDFFNERADLACCDLFVCSAAVNGHSVAADAVFPLVVGNSLQRAWGDFRFMMYILVGMVGALAACLITGSAGASGIFLSLFFAYAWMWPDQQVLLFFILPIKMKWMGIAAAAMWVLEFLTGNFASRVSLLFGIAGFLAFFGGEMFTTAKDAIVSYKRRKDWEKKINRK